MSIRSSNSQEFAYGRRAAVPYRLPGYLRFRDVIPLVTFVEHHKFGPEQLLLMALLIDAIEEMNCHNGKHWRSNAAAVRRWIFKSDSYYFPISFEMCCDGLYLDPDAVRKKLLTKKPHWSKHAA